MAKRITLTAHARIRLQERQYDLNWVEKIARNPDWVEPEPEDQELERRFGGIEDAEGRILRVVCAETETEIRIISVMFDRNARRKP